MFCHASGKCTQKNNVSAIPVTVLDIDLDFFLNERPDIAAQGRARMALHLHPLCPSCSHGDHCFCSGYAHQRVLVFGASDGAGFAAEFSLFDWQGQGGFKRCLPDPRSQT